MPAQARHQALRDAPQHSHQAIRVAHVAALSQESASGVDRTVMGLVTHLQNHDILPEVWHLDPSYRTVRERRLDPVTVVELPARTKAGSALLGLPSVTRQFILSRRAEVDLVHLHSVFIPDNLWVARLAGLPYVLTPHGGYSREVLHGRRRVAKAVWLRFREERYIRAAALVHAVSSSEAEQLRTRFQIDAVVYVPNAVEAAPPHLAANDAARVGRKQIVFLGRLAVDHKGLDTLLYGYGLYLDRQRDADSELIIAGPDFRSGRAELEKLAAGLVPAGRVRFPGPLFGNDKEELLRTSTVFVHTSRWEGMPYSILEALAAGSPVLLTPATNLGGDVEEYGAGVVVEGTAEGIQEGLARVLDSTPERYAAMCDAARRLVSERFTWPVAAERMAAAYRRVLS